MTATHLACRLLHRPWRRPGGGKAPFRLGIKIRRQWTLVQNVHIRSQVIRVHRADDGGVQVGIAEREPENEFHRRHFAK